MRINVEDKSPAEYPTYEPRKNKYAWIVESN